MSDSQLAYAVTYLLSFRLAIVVLGGLSIYLGYRLFTHALSPSGRGADADTEISGRFKDAEITLRNAAPGTCFAAFGAALTISVLAGSPPEFGVSNSMQTRADGQTRAVSELVARGDEGGAAAKPEEIYAGIKRSLASALSESRGLANTNPDRPAFKALQAKLEFVHDKYDKARDAQEDAVEFDDGPEQLKRLAAYSAAYDSIAGRTK